MEYEAFEPGIEVNGQTVYAIVDGFGSFRRLAENILIEEKIGERDRSGRYLLQMDGWYSQEGWLRAFKRIGQEVGQSVLYDIGTRIPSNAKFPDWVVDVPSAIRSVDIAYHMNHRKKGEVMFSPSNGSMLEGIGHYGFEQAQGKNVIISRCENPYPCAFDEGILTAMARRFDRLVSVRHDPGECRHKGGDACTYLVEYS
ncbi:MAG: hypothetical protein R3B07_05260 [Polyangiaceae bacterium]